MTEKELEKTLRNFDYSTLSKRDFNKFYKFISKYHWELRKIRDYREYADSKEK